MPFTEREKKIVKIMTDALDEIREKAEGELKGYVSAVETDALLSVIHITDEPACLVAKDNEIKEWWLDLIGASEDKPVITSYNSDEWKKLTKCL